MLLCLAVSAVLQGCSGTSAGYQASFTPGTAAPEATERTDAIPGTPEPSVTRMAPAHAATPEMTETPVIEPSLADRVAEAARSLEAEAPESVQAVLARLGVDSAQSADGPLAAEVLRRAGVLPGEASPRHFWLLDPLKDPAAAERLLPHEDFVWQKVNGPPAAYDYPAGPLAPGDLLYLLPAHEEYIGMYLAVSRVDVEGRAYSLIFQPGGRGGEFQVGETLLYDPSDPTQGWLRNSPEARFGRGMLRWRPRSYGGMAELEARLNRILNRGGKWSVLVKTVGGEVAFSREADAAVHPASIIKVPLGILVLESFREESRPLSEALEQAPPQAGRTYGQLLHAMLALSEETATDLLEKDLRSRMGEGWIRTTLDGWGAPQTTLEPRRTTARELDRFFEGLFDASLIGTDASRMLLGWLSEITAGDSVRLAGLGSMLPEGSVIYNKRGSLTNPVIVADAGIIVLPGGEATFLCLLGYPDEWTTFEELDQIITDFGMAWYQGAVVEGLRP